MEILIGILGNAAYDIIKNKIVQVFGKSDNNRNTKLIHAINKAAKRFLIDMAICLAPRAALF